MKIDLKTLGLADDASLADVQKVLDGQDFFSQSEVDTAKNAAASGARSAAESKWQKKLDAAGKLSEDDAKILATAKRATKLTALKKNETLAKLSDEDFELIVDANDLTNKTEDELKESVKTISTKYADRFTNGLPPQSKHENNNNNNNNKDVDNTPPIGKMGIFGN